MVPLHHATDRDVVLGFIEFLLLGSLVFWMFLRVLFGKRRTGRGRYQDVRRGPWWDAYHAYLQSPQWHARRALVHTRSGGMCEKCRRRPGREVHHKTYARVGREKLSDLQYLCYSCHDGKHA